MRPRKLSLGGNYRRSASRRPQDMDILDVRLRTHVVQQQRNRRLISMTTRLILLAFLLGGGFFGVREGLRRYVWENPEYRLAVVEIQNDGPSLTREAVLAATGLELGTNVFKIDLPKARKAIAELPQVERVEVNRVLPNKVAVTLSERRPVAWLANRDELDATASDRSFLIDARGVIFKVNGQVAEYLLLPVIYGIQLEGYQSGNQIATPELGAALELISLNSAFNRFHFRSIDLTRGYWMEVIDARRTRITFDTVDVAGQLDRLNAIYDHLASSKQEIQTVNLLVRENIPVRLGTPPSEEELLAVAARSAGSDPDEPTVAGEEAAVAALLEAEEAAAAPTPAPAPVKTAAAPAPSPKKPAARTARSESRSTPRNNRSSSREKPVKAAIPIRKAKPAPSPVIRRAIPVQPQSVQASVIPAGMV